MGYRSLSSFSHVAEPHRVFAFTLPAMRHRAEPLLLQPACAALFPVRMKTRNSQIPVIGFCAALAILAGISAVSYLRLQEFAERARLVEHTQKVLREIEVVLSDLKDVETGVRGYLISRQEPFLDPYVDGLASVPVHMRRLKELTVDNDAQQKRIRVFEQLTDKRLQQATLFLRMASAENLPVSEPARKHIAASKLTMDEIRDVASDMRAHEEILLAERAEDSARSLRQATAIIVAGTLTSFTILVIAFVLLRSEIGQRARAEHAAQASAAETESLYNEAPCGYHSVDKHGTFVRINDTELAWLGYDRDEVVGKLKFIDVVAPECVQTVQENFPNLVKGAITTNLEYTMVRKDGSTFPVSVNAVPLLDADGNYVMSRTTMFDTTAMKRVEHQFRETNAFLDAVVENIPSMIFVKDAASLRFARINRAEEALLGIPRAALIGKSDHELFPAEQADFFTAKDREVLASHATMDIAEERLTTAHGLRILHTRKIALRDDQGQPRYLLGISEDITERKLAEERIQALNRDLEMRANQLEAANKELESFGYSVSHDLRSPLRAIDGFSRILEDDHGDKLDEEGRRLLTVVRANSQKMGQLIDDLLALSRLGRKPLTASRLDMRALALEALSEVLAGARHSSNVVVGNLPAAWGDQVLLKQVWVNLIANAIKYSSTKENAKIEIGGATENDQSGSRSTYFVRDNGVGFDMRYYDKLFGAFQRLHGAAEFSGTGVGLAIVQRAVTRLGGRVWAEAKVGEGATFFFSLPEKVHDDRTGTS